MDAIFDFLYELDADIIKVNQYQLDAKERKRIRDSIRVIFHSYARSILNFKSYMVSLACNKDPFLEQVISDIPQLTSGVLTPALDRFLRRIALHYTLINPDVEARPSERVSSSALSEGLGKRTELPPAQETQEVTRAEQASSRPSFPSRRLYRHQQDQKQTQEYVRQTHASRLKHQPVQQQASGRPAEGKLQPASLHRLDKPRRNKRRPSISRPLRFRQ